MKEKNQWSILMGAAFLMASSAIGPGFLTQTALFTQELGASFAFVILLSIVLDAVAQLNIWRIITVAKKPAQDIANSLIPGLGYFLSLLVFFGGLAFNVGNLAGAGLGLNVLFGITVGQGALISAVLALGIFLFREAGTAMDTFAKIMGILKIGLALFIAFITHPPVKEAVIRSVIPIHFSFLAVLTVVGGTVGGYITFAGAHRLIDAHQAGIENISSTTKGALSAIGLASLMRILLFLAALGVITRGGVLSPANPAASIFQWALGGIGYKIFGLIIWAAGTSCVVGSAYTSVSFIKSFHPWILKFNKEILVVFILVSCSIFLIVGKPVKTLVVVGAINGLILPLALGIMLFAAYRKKIIDQYRQPLWLTILGIMVVGTMFWMSTGAILQMIRP
jgi:Mn2+/Fe2+ NRAMP family transporter